MGSTARAKLAYGYRLGDDESGWKVHGVDEYERWQPSWLTPDDDPDSDAVIEACEQRLLVAAGFTDADWRADVYFDRKSAAEKQIGVEFTFSGHHEYAGVLLVASGSRRSVEWSEVMILDLDAMTARPGEERWDDKLRSALRVLDLSPVQEGPRWLVFPTYG